MRQLFAIAAAALTAWGCGGGNDAPADGSGDGGGGDGPQGAGPVGPIAPSAGNPMYQGSQRDFRTGGGAGGDTCKGRVAASMGGTGFCFLAADDNVKCSGVIGGVDFGMTPADVGVTGAEQIMVFFLNDGMCVTRTDHTVQCMGTNTNAFGNTLTTTFSRWTTRSDIAAIGTGTWNEICGITTGGQVYCGGGVYGNPPVAVGASDQTSLWVDTGGTAHSSDPMVLRPGESRTECTVRAEGLVCGGTPYGPANGIVVNGSRSSGGGAADFYCWLESSGSVNCTTGARFAPGKVLFLAASYYTDSLCAIYNDGSIWCMGSNSNGKLGTGNTTPLATATMVAPPGTARVRCE